MLYTADGVADAIDDLDRQTERQNWRQERAAEWKGEKVRRIGKVRIIGLKVGGEETRGRGKCVWDWDVTCGVGCAAGL